MNRLWVRLTLAFMAVTLIGVATVAVLTDWSAGREFRQYLARQEAVAASGLLEELAAYYASNGKWDGVANLLGGAAGGRGRGQARGGPPVILANAGGTIVYDDRGGRAGSLLSAEERSAAVPIKVNEGTVGYLLVGGPGRGAIQPTEQAFLDQLRTALVVAALVAGGLGMLTGLLVSRMLSAPLAELARAARAFAGRDWSRRVRVEGADEIAEVGREFNEMASAIQQGETLRRNMMADIAHELRTPIAVLQGNLRAMLDEVYPLERREIATLYDETRLLTRLVDDLRELALADAGQLPLNLHAVDVAPALDATAEHFAAAAEATGLKLAVEVAGDVRPVRADPDRLAQVLNNLVANAVRHTPAGGTITLSAQSAHGIPSHLTGFERRSRDGAAKMAHDLIRICVADSGEGIAAEDLPHVFERFYRSDKSRARASGGTGLGLAIAKAWVQAMGGTIGAESEPGRGSRFWFDLPIA